ncbi:MAG: 23S rRNA (adenine(2030)-N(6))-methyltransferase RlmJ [Rhodobacterales bacterium]|nr:23S rRNA (adenine(2030)-N(6))-methyltransferase RlmJ [Rhodobacterales bacterium]NCT12887.1 23S rRNA (adenine(2030)-N(6))-methyltransferase RlmJ [Rhodobacterales bacterium]
MLSYQHAYHAANLADVHKHALLAWVLDYLTRKDKPLSYIETHAGRGLYDLEGEAARKTGEAAQGFDRVAGWFGPDHPYAVQVARTRALHGVRAYPGSPLIAAQALRPGDRMHLAELHPQEFAALSYTMSPHEAHVAQREGAEFALSLTPPDPRRGLCLIDPSYEVKDDYVTIPLLVQKLHRKWPVGIIMLWFPLLAGNPHAQILARLGGMEGVLRHIVRFPPARPGHGMTGSGLVVINPPYGLAEQAAWLEGKFAQLS